MRIRATLAALVLVLVAGPTGAETTVEAELDWHQRTTLGTPVSGTIGEVPVEAGDRVSAEEPLVALDQRRFEASVARAEARVDRWEEDEARLRRDWERAEELYARGVLADQELEQTRGKHVTAESELRGARAELELAEIDREDATIRAPFPALVLDVLARPGQTVVSELQSEPLVVIAHRNQMVARAWLSWEETETLSRGEAARVGVDNEWFDGEIRRVGLEAGKGRDGDGDAARYPVEVVFEFPPERRFRSGQPAQMELPL